MTEVEQERMEDEGGPALPPKEDEQPQAPEDTNPSVMVGPHVLGGIQLVARDRQGGVTSTRLDLNEAAVLVTHLQALMTMMFQAMYMQAAQQEEQASKIHIPRS